MMYEALSLRCFEDQSVITHTTGSLVTATVNGANQTGNTLTVNALGGTINAGDVFTIAGVNAVNRENYQNLGTVAQFGATAAAAAGATSISVYPPIVPPPTAVPHAR